MRAPNPARRTTRLNLPDGNLRSELMPLCIAVNTGALELSEIENQDFRRAAAFYLNRARIIEGGRIARGKRRFI